MNCPQCKLPIEPGSMLCNNCGLDLNKMPWVLLSRVYPPNDIIIQSLLDSCGIPNRVIRNDVPQMPVTIGPMAEVRILVPGHWLDQAQALLDEMAETDADNNT